MDGSAVPNTRFVGVDASLQSNSDPCLRGLPTFALQLLHGRRTPNDATYAPRRRRTVVSSARLYICGGR